MDRIVALYATPDTAERARVHLGRKGVATDRMDVVSTADHGRVVDFPDQNFAKDLGNYLHTLLTQESERSLIHGLVDAVLGGKAVLVVHPRGKIEIDMAEEIIEEHEPETVLWRVAPPEAQGGLLGEHAAGFKS